MACTLTYLPLGSPLGPSCGPTCGLRSGITLGRSLQEEVASFKTRHATLILKQAKSKFKIKSQLKKEKKKRILPRQPWVPEGTLETRKQVTWAKGFAYQGQSYINIKLRKPLFLQSFFF